MSTPNIHLEETRYGRYVAWRFQPSWLSRSALLEKRGRDNEQVSGRGSGEAHCGKPRDVMKPIRYVCRAIASRVNNVHGVADVEERRVVVIQCLSGMSVETVQDAMLNAR